MIGFSAYYTGASVHVFYERYDDIKAILTPAAGQRINYDLIIPTLLAIPGMLPNALMALILLLVLSASMSTLSSLVLVSSSAVAIDLYPSRVDAKTGKDRSVAMMRFLSAIFIVISYLISRTNFSIIVYLMALSWGVVSGSFAAPYILGLYSKRVTKAGAYAGLISGITIMITLYFVLGQRNSPLSASIAIVVPFIVVTVVSLLTKPPSKEILDKAFNGV
jgi:SSS family solute:Na+ symporter